MPTRPLIVHRITARYIAHVGHGVFRAQLPKDVFGEVAGSFRLDGIEQLPWLTFDPVLLTLVGVPTNADVHRLRLLATGAGAKPPDAPVLATLGLVAMAHPKGYAASTDSYFIVLPTIPFT